MNKKNLKALIILFAITFVGLQSCEKKEIVSETEISKNEVYKLPETILKGINVENGILQFQNNEHINKVMSSLENEEERLIEEFQEKYKKLSIEEKELKAKEIKFNPNIVYETFEKSLGFNSLRAKIAKEEEQWLKNEDLDMEKDPNNYYIDGNGQRSVITTDGILMIGSSIFVAKDNGITIEIKNQNFNILKDVLNNNFTKSDNIVIYGKNTDKGTWRSVSTRSLYWTKYEYPTTYKMSGRITIDNRPWAHYVKSTTKVYWLDGSTWRTANLYVHMYTSVGGTIYKYKSPHRYYKTVSGRYPAAGAVYGHTTIHKTTWYDKWFKTKRNAVYSTHYCNKVGTKTVYLTW